MEEHVCTDPASKDPNAHYKCRCTCGYAPGTFACKIRHLQINTGAAKAASPNVEITQSGRIIR